MFPAYSSAGESSAPKQNETKSQKEVGSDWLKSQSFSRVLQLKTEPKESDSSYPEEGEKKYEPKKAKKSKSNDSEDTQRTKKHKKKDKKSKKKKKKRSHSSSTSIHSSDSSLMEEEKEPNVIDLLCDKTYIEFFSRFTTDEIKKSYFFDDFQGLTYRNAFRIDRKGDKNNLCFDSLHFKQLAKYKTPFEAGMISSNNKTSKQTLKSKKKLTRKQLRRYIINELKQKRYFVQVEKFKSDIVQKESKTQLPKNISSTLSDKMWLYLEMKKEFNADRDQKSMDKTGDYMKYLTENKNDIQKWLEFIDYQSHSTNEKQLNQLVVYERKLSIFEKAIKENPTSFRLRIELIKLKANSIEIIEAVNAVEKVEADYLALLFSESSLSYQIISKMKNFDQLKILTNLFEIWFEMIKFFISNTASNLNFNKIKRVFVKFFQYFLNSSNPIIIKNMKSNLFLNSILKGIEIYCQFLSRAGYFEKGLAVYQSIIDLNFCTNSASYTDLDLKSRKSMFELFAEIGLPKFGENLSTGWLKCLESRDSLFQKLESEIDLNRYDDYLDANEEKLLAMKSIRIEYRWLEIERLRSIFNWYPFYAKTAIGESIDDCIDPDRLINFEEDTSFTLFDFNEDTEYFRFNLLCKFFKYLHIITWNEESLDLKLNTNEMTNQSLNDLNVRLAILTSNLTEDNEYAEYLNEKFSFFEQTSLNLHDGFSFIKDIFDFLFVLDNECFNLLDETEKINRVKTVKYMAKNAIDFVRNCLTQSITSFSTAKYRISLIVLKWKFELSLLQMLSHYKQIASEFLQKELGEYFEPKIIKQNLLNQSKLDLSLEANRSNFDLWKQYGILKWLLNHSKFNYDTNKSVQSLKETRKVFDTLLAKSATNGVPANLTDCIDVFCLCADYVELELGIYYRQFDIEATSLNTLEFDIGFASIHIQNGLFDLSDQGEIKLQPLKKEEIVSISEMLVKNCLNIEVESKTKAKATFQIGITGSTRLLLIKRDFQNEYLKLSNECKTGSEKNTNLNDTYLAQKKFFHFHRIHSLFLLCVDDLEKLIELNDSILKQSIAPLFYSKLIEFYLTLLNYLHFQQNRITKFMYRSKVFAIIRSLIPFNSNYSQQNSCQKSLVRLLQVSLIRFKLRNSNLFCSQLIENNDIDLVVQQMGIALSYSCSSLVWLSLIFSNINRLERLTRAAHEQQQAVSSNSGIHHQIRRQFEQAVKFNSKSFQLWLFYLQFELKYSNDQSGSNNHLLYVYYQSIRNVPYCKTLFLNAIRCLPEKYNEIMSLLYVKEIRLYLPIQELNILLEPIKDKSELAYEDEHNHKSQLGLIDLNASSSSSSNSSRNSNSSISNSENENDSDESVDSLVEDNKSDLEFDSNSSEDGKLEFD